MFNRQFYISVNRFLSRSVSTDAAKPFADIPTVSTIKLILRSFPGGKYYQKSIKDINKLFYEEYGKVVKLPAVLGNPEIVMAFTAEDFETVK